jgi:alginate O-acetyltransferase complex protein AlgI
MNVTDIQYYAFMAGIILILHICLRIFSNKERIRIFVLILASVLFISLNDVRFLVVTLLDAVVVYAAGLMLSRKKNPVILSCTFIYLLAALGYFKYYNFFADSFNYFGIPMKHMDIILPVGISFYTFSAISYVAEIYLGRAQAIESFPEVLLYICFFAKLTAGPLMKPDDFFSQIRCQKNGISSHDLSAGLQIIASGMVKKRVLADNISVFVDNVYGNIAEFKWTTLAVAVVAYGLQLYFDFSGYSDIAIGCGKCLGFDFPKNFDLPFLSQNMTELWKRWHITLSEWLMRYIYIPLGGSRKGYPRQLLNLMITMTVGGLWHGAGWNFVLWGFIQGALLCIHKQYKKLAGHSRKNRTVSLPVFCINAVLTMLLFDISFVVFRITDIGKAGFLFRRILTFGDGVSYFSPWLVIGFAALAAGSAVCIVRSIQHSEKGACVSEVHGFYVIRSLQKYINLVILFVVIGLVLGLAYAQSNPFIYAAF